MPRFEIDIDPADHITADAIGRPGQRVFYLQGWQGTRTITVIIEKIQLQSLGAGILKFMQQIIREHPSLPEPDAEYAEEQMRINPPVDPLFRVGELGLAYDASRDLVVIITREIILDNMEPDDAAVVRFWCTRAQVLALARWGEQVVQKGRPICTQCGQPMEPEGHFCPKKNGYLH